MFPRERIEIIQGDITAQEVDAIVNAANESLLGGGGVDGAIHRAAGPKLLEETQRLGGCPTGDCKISKGYNLKARHVIHCVGPVWHGGGSGEDGLLAGCYRAALSLAKAHGLKSLAFPAISTGVYAFPRERATRIALKTVLGEADQSLELIRFVCFDEETAETYRRVFDTLGA